MIKKQVILADGHPLILEALASRLRESGRFDVVAAVSDSDQAFYEIFERRPDLVIMELELSGRGSLDVAEQVACRLPQTQLVFYTSYDTDIFLELALRLKVSGYFLKHEPVDFLMNGLKRISRGEAVYSESTVKRLEMDIDQNRYTVKSQSFLASLTLRQLQVLRHLAQGASVKEVARQMRLSERAIESHKYRIMQKMGIHDRVMLTRFAIREGLMPA